MVNFIALIFIVRGTPWFETKQFPSVVIILTMHYTSHCWVQISSTERVYFSAALSQYGLKTSYVVCGLRTVPDF